MERKLSISSLLLLIIGIFSCDNNNISIDENCPELNSYTIYALNHGDTNIYDSISRFYMKSACPDKLSLYSAVFAEKYKYGIAYADCYYLYTAFFDFGESKRLDNLALYYLARSKECGYKFDSIKFKDVFLEYEEIKPSLYYINANMQE